MPSSTPAPEKDPNLDATNVGDPTWEDFIEAEKSLPKLGVRFGPFHLDRHLGEGGLGQVFRAKDTRNDEIVAVKILLRPSKMMIARLEGGGRLPSMKTLIRYAQATGARPVVKLVPENRRGK
ncbi:MAG: hypothetical protein IIA40_12270 [SAR324 cluster bacterium]|nr:hypothetical protein [SAR324 cluster bacterium]